MALDLNVFAVGEPAGLVEDEVGDPELADVVQERGATKATESPDSGSPTTTPVPRAISATRSE